MSGPFTDRSDATLAELWVDAAAFRETGIAAGSKLREATAVMFGAERATTLQMMACVEAIGAEIANRALAAGFGKPSKPPLAFLTDDEFVESDWADVQPADGEVWVADTNAVVRVLARVHTDEFAVAPYHEREPEPEWTKTLTRGQLCYRAGHA